MHDRIVRDTGDWFWVINFSDPSRSMQEIFNYLNKIFGNNFLIDRNSYRNSLLY